MASGAGADGGATPRFAAYGSTKRGLAQFQKSLSAELKLQKLDNVVIHNLSPGMVATGRWDHMCSICKRLHSCL